jgi:voltage-gated potassium channel
VKAGLSRIDTAICVLIVASVLVAVLETEPTIFDAHKGLFRAAELVFATVFLIEYVLRFWIVGARAPSPWRVRARWVVSPPALIDLAAIVPGLMFLGGTPAFGLRLFRIVRILRIARLGRFTRAFGFLSEAIRSRQYELYLTFIAALIFLLLAATVMYLVEGRVQPSRFGSIPRALWWATVTLTTIGYGDVTPATTLGRAVAGVTAFVGIGLVAAPTGILAAAFSEAAHRQRNGSES